MGPFDEKYVIDDSGERVQVILGFEQFQRILGELEELESIREYDAAKADGGDPVPLEQAIDEIEKQRT